MNNEKINNPEIVEDISTEDEENKLVLKFTKPYKFEGEEYNEVDLSNLENLTASDMIAAQKQVNKGGNVDIIPEMSLQYACIISARVSKKPIEFFTALPAKEAIKLKNIVTGFLYSVD